MSGSGLVRRSKNVGSLGGGSEAARCRNISPGGNWSHAIFGAVVDCINIADLMGDDWSLGNTGVRQRLTGPGRSDESIGGVCEAVANGF